VQSLRQAIEKTQSNVDFKVDQDTPYGQYTSPKSKLENYKKKSKLQQFSTRLIADRACTNSFSRTHFRPLHRGGDGRRRRPGRDGVPGEERRRRGGVPVHGHQGDLRLPLHHRRRRLQGAEAEGRRHLAGARMVRPGHPVLHGLRRRRLSSVTVNNSEHRRTNHHFIHRMEQR
jgi:hypothetical protein